MGKREKTIVPCLAALWCMAGLTLTHCGRGINCCVIKMPPITFTSERTSLENQILGTYREIREDVWIISSAQTVEGLKVSSLSNTNAHAQASRASVDFRVIRALETVQYNEERIRGFLAKNLAGENNQGFLSYREESSVENNPEEKKKLLETLGEVNDARLVLMLEVINRNKKLTVDDLDKVKKTFAEMNQKSALQGEWIQLESDEWIKKQQ